MWLLRLMMRLPRPLARAWKRFSVGRLVDLDARDLQLVDVRVVVVLGVGDRRLQHLAHDLRALLRREAQRRERTAHGLAAHHVRHEAALLRRDARVLAALLQPACAYSAASSFLSPEWPLNVRVGANSPSLWPTMFSVHEHRDVLPAVVHGDREADHVRQDHRAARPGLDRPAIVLVGRDLHLLREVQIDERAFLD